MFVQRTATTSIAIPVTAGLIAMTAMATSSAPPTIPIADGLDYPVGAPNAEGYYDAQDFGINDHLGEDWNIQGAGDADLGAPVMSIGHGLVTQAFDAKGGWGKLVRIVHRVPRTPKPGYVEVESFYAHLDELHVSAGDVVLRGQQIGTIGDADGVYIPHLHFELRSWIGRPIGPGYAKNKDGYLDPSEFIDQHRPAARGW